MVIDKHILFRSMYNCTSDERLSI